MSTFSYGLKISLSPVLCIERKNKSVSYLSLKSVCSVLFKFDVVVSLYLCILGSCYRFVGGSTCSLSLGVLNCHLRNPTTVDRIKSDEAGIAVQVSDNRNG